MHHRPIIMTPPLHPAQRVLAGAVRERGKNWSQGISECTTNGKDTAMGHSLLLSLADVRPEREPSAAVTGEGRNSYHSAPSISFSLSRVNAACAAHCNDTCGKSTITAIFVPPSACGTSPRPFAHGVSALQHVGGRLTGSRSGPFGQLTSQ